MSSASLQLLIEAVDNASADVAKIRDEMDKLAVASAKAEKASSGFGDKMKNVGKGMAKAGAVMTASVTAPIVAIGATSIKASVEMNKLMGNVQALGISGDRVVELKSSVQDLAVETGTSTSLVAAGLYEVISAVGDTSDTIKVLDINTRLAAAGQATVSEAIALTTAVTKAYGDTSLEAFKKADDLATKTVELGQTNLPELASALPKVTSLSQALGVSQEELFATMATGTGVMGNASEIATQVKASLSGLMAPSKGLKTLMGELGYESGAAMIEQLGFAGTLQKITSAAEESGVELQQFMGSVEAQNLMLGLSGAGAERYARNLEEMGNAAGSGARAFDAQTKGINKSGFEMAQAAVQVQVLQQQLGDALAPSVGKVVAQITPLVKKLAEFIEKNPGLTETALKFAMIAAAIGPVLIGLGALAASVGAITKFAAAIKLLSGISVIFSGIASGFAVFGSVLAGVFGFIGTVLSGLLTFVGTVMVGIAAFLGIPVWAAALLVAALVAAAIWIIANWGMVKEFFANLWEGIKEHAGNALNTIKENFNTLKASAQNTWSNIKQKASEAVTGLVTAFQNGVARVRSAMTDIRNAIVNTLTNVASQAMEAGRKIVAGIAQGIRNGIGAVSSAASAVAAAVKSKLPNSPVPEGPLTVLNGRHNAGYKIAEMLATGLSAGSGLLSGAMGGATEPMAATASAPVPMPATGGNSTSNSFSPNVTINVNGGADVAGQVDRQLEETFARLFAQYKAQQARVSYG